MVENGKIDERRNKVEMKERGERKKGERVLEREN